MTRSKSTRKRAAQKLCARPKRKKHRARKRVLTATERLQRQWQQEKKIRRKEFRDRARAAQCHLELGVALEPVVTPAPTPRPARKPKRDAHPFQWVQLTLRFTVLQRRVPMPEPQGQRITIIEAPPGYGGPDRSKPCEGCPRRKICKTACVLLEAILPVEEIEEPNEISSTALMAGRGYSESFMTMPIAETMLDPDDDPDELWPKIVEIFGPQLRDAIAKLPETQRETLTLYADGVSRATIMRTRGVSRQAVHKVFWAGVEHMAHLLGARKALRKLREEL